MHSINIQKVNLNAVVPTYGSEGAAGADLYACLETPVRIDPGEDGIIPTGIAVEIPKGFAGLIYARSGMACKRGLAPANKVGVIDSDYRGEMIVVLHNHSNETEYIYDKDRIAQFVLTPVWTPSFNVCKELSDTVRASGGFGSTGTR